MKSSLTAILFAVMLVAPLSAHAASLNVYPGTCSFENNQCKRFCTENAPNNGCFGDCSGRQVSCLKTGTYYWKHRPTKTGLERK